MAALRHDRDSEIREARAKADPTLRRILQSADDDGEVSVSLTLKPVEHREVAVENALKRAESLSGTGPISVNLLKNIPYLILKAKPRYIDALLSDSLIESVLLNDQPEDIVIRPVKKGSGG